MRIAALGIDAEHSNDAALELQRLCAEADHVVERAEALRALRSARPRHAARVALTQLHDLSTFGVINAPLRIECAATITPECSDEDGFDRLVEARLHATERRFDDDSDDGAWELERAIANWFEYGEAVYPECVRLWTASYVSSSFRRGRDRPT